MQVTKFSNLISLQKPRRPEFLSTVIELIIKKVIPPVTE